MIKIGFILLSIMMLLLLFRAVSFLSHQALGNSANAKRQTHKTILILTGWCTYIGLISATGFLSSTTLPPRVPLFLILPCFAFMIYFFKNPKFKQIISDAPMTWITYSQSFRVIVELLLLGLYAEGLLPKAATFEGYNYEILIGATAIPMAYLVTKHPKRTKCTLMAWNICGLLTLSIVVFIILSNTYQTATSTDIAPVHKIVIGRFPYTLLAGFLMPLAVFMHILSLVKIRMDQNRSIQGN
jgi:hypothetical protein